MKNNIYNIELLEYKKDILKDFEYKLKYSVLSRINSNSKAHEEIKKLISETTSKIIELENEINLYFETNKDMNSNFKIKTETLKDIIEIKTELKIDSIPELLSTLVTYYKDLILIDKLSEVKHINLNKEIEHNLNKSDLYVCSVEREKGIFVYKIEDLVIHQNMEYINIEKFKKFIIVDETFNFSLNYTLEDINKFEILWK